MIIGKHYKKPITTIYSLPADDISIIQSHQYQLDIYSHRFHFVQRIIRFTFKEDKILNILRSYIFMIQTHYTQNMYELKKTGRRRVGLVHRRFCTNFRIRLDQDAVLYEINYCNNFYLYYKFSFFGIFLVTIIGSSCVGVIIVNLRKILYTF